MSSLIIQDLKLRPVQTFRSIFEAESASISKASAFLVTSLFVLTAKRALSAQKSDYQTLPDGILYFRPRKSYFDFNKGITYFITLFVPTLGTKVIYQNHLVIRLAYR